MKTLYKMRFIPLLLTPLLVAMMVLPGTLVAADPPVTVPLGDTTTFAVLAHTAITDTGTGFSIINGADGGNVGLSPTAGTGITVLKPVQVAGTIYAVDDTGPAGPAGNNPALLTSAKTDLDAAYNNAATRTPTETFTGTNLLGGKTLTTGVYAFTSGATDLTGTLKLNAQGNEEAVFIFQASSTLITASDSKVELINGARFCRVFWVVPSSATLGTDSTFVGHIFALTSITATTRTTVYGQLLARTGAVTLDYTTITNGPCPTTAVTTTTAAPTTTTAAPAETTAAITAETTAAITAETTAAPAETTAAPAETTAAPAETTAAPVTTTVTGGQIPKTSTPWYNVLIAGAALTLIGAMGWWITRKVYV